jgi:hypothetical protein
MRKLPPYSTPPRAKAYSALPIIDGDHARVESIEGGQAIDPWIVQGFFPL